MLVEGNLLWSSNVSTGYIFYVSRIMHNYHAAIYVAQYYSMVHFLQDAHTLYPTLPS